MRRVVSLTLILLPLTLLTGRAATRPQDRSAQQIAPGLLSLIHI